MRRKWNEEGPPAMVGRLVLLVALGFAGASCSGGPRSDAPAGSPVDTPAAATTTSPVEASPTPPATPTEGDGQARPSEEQFLGDGSFRVYAVLHNPAVAPDPNVFRPRYGMILTAITGEDVRNAYPNWAERVAFVLNWVPASDGWRIINLTYYTLPPAGPGDDRSAAVVLSKDRAQAEYPGATWTRLPGGK
jgi:hypothetical protein